ncbi:hypothetical protein FRC15_007265 [Serendipita sp. 397]|nr:hypothetical protein FRC15_007265 [Serendipita sp. 397]
MPKSYSLGDFTLCPYSPSPSSHLSIKKHRIVLNVSVLRDHGIEAGDCICISWNQAGVTPFIDGLIVGIAWPSGDLDPKCVAVHPAVTPTTQTDQVAVSKLIGAAPRQAVSVTVKISSSQSRAHQWDKNTAPEDKEKDWLSLSILELLGKDSLSNRMRQH